MDQVRRDLAQLQSEVDRLNREKLEDRLRILSLEQSVAKENAISLPNVFEGGKTLVQVVANSISAAAPAAALLVCSLTNALGARKKKKSKKAALSDIADTKFL